MYSIWQIAIVHLNQKTYVQGVVIQGDGKLPEGGNIRRILRVYRMAPASQLNLIFHANGVEINFQTNKQGGFEFECDHLEDDHFSISHQGEKLPVVQHETYPLHFHLDDHHKYVISDIDDTILYSHSPHALKRIFTALLVGPDRRRPIRSTHHLLKSLENKGYCTVYLSKSESNLLPNLTHYMVKNGLPKSLMFLTPFLRGSQLLNARKDPDHKIKRIRFLMDQTQGKVVLIGDDGQKDMEIYTQACREYGDRIEKVYIYQTIRTLSRRKRSQWQQLLDTGVNAEYYREYQP